MKISKVYFNTEDNLRLIGLLHEPDDIKTNVVIISVHGLTSNCLKYRDDVIAKKVTENNIAYFTFDNRGHEVLNTYDSFDKMNFEGSAAEDIKDSYYDIKAAIETMLLKKYNKIILQGHSLGCTKIVYTYNRFLEQKENKLLNPICGVSLLSMVDVPGYLKNMLGDNLEKVFKFLDILKSRNGGDKIVSIDNFPPVKPNTVLNYRENSDIDFFKYQEPKYKFEKINNIKEPLFMRWGTERELITMEADKLVNMLEIRIKNNYKDINFISGADHSYHNKENILADQILNWITKYYIGL